MEKKFQDNPETQLKEVAKTILENTKKVYKNHKIKI